MKHNNLYFRDGVKMPREAWWKHLNADIEIIEKRYDFAVKNAIYTDVSNGRSIVVNQHQYTQRIDEEYDNAKELIASMLLYGRPEPILDALEDIPDDVAKLIVPYIKGVTQVNGQYVFAGQE